MQPLQQLWLLCLCLRCELLLLLVHVLLDRCWPQGGQGIRPLEQVWNSAAHRARADACASDVVGHFIVTVPSGEPLPTKVNECLTANRTGVDQIHRTRVASHHSIYYDCTMTAP
jgi:hypothetical protein